jgi:hypothetical protein
MINTIALNRSETKVYRSPRIKEVLRTGIDNSVSEDTAHSYVAEPCLITDIHIDSCRRAWRAEQSDSGRKS